MIRWTLAFALTAAISSPAAAQSAVERGSYLVNTIMTCANCHSPDGDLKGIASKYSDPRSLQNAWVAGTSAANPFGGRGGGGAGNPVTVTMPDGQKFEGKLVRKDDYIVILMLADGTRKSIPLDVTPAPKVEMKDPQEAHKKMAMMIDDPDNKNLHDITAFLWTLKSAPQK